jgi:hypothetical protein
MRNGTILSGVYAVRIDAVQALLAAADRRANNGACLRTLANALDEVTTRYDDARVAVAYSAFASLMRTLAMLVDWRAGVLEAAVDADRFLRSGRELHRAWLDEYGEREEVAGLANSAASIAELDAIGKVGLLCQAVGSVPLPIGIYAADTRRRIPLPTELDGEDRAPPPPALSVAFIRFNINGQPGWRNPLSDAEGSA